MLVAVVVPHEEETKKWAYSSGHAGSLSDLCALDQLQNYVLSELKSTAGRKKVRFANWNSFLFRASEICYCSDTLLVWNCTYKLHAHKLE